MTANGLLQVALFFAVLTALAVPLGRYMAAVYEGRAGILDRVLGPLERLLYRLAGVDPSAEMSWRRYAGALLLFNAVGFSVVYALQRLQAWLPLNPAGLPGVGADVALNTAVSFATNTNWQAYGGETTMSQLTQMLGLTVQNFLSAATGMAVLVALVRGFTRREAESVGNFWVDLTRSTLHVLLPLSFVVALILTSQGVPQSFEASARATLLEATTAADGSAVTEQEIALGPVASQIAIKQLGTNGGGYYNANAAHPLENPTPLSNFVEMLSILLIAGALCFSFGELVKDRRQGWALYAVMCADPDPAAARLPGRRTARQPGRSTRSASIRPPARSRPAATWKARRRASASPTRCSGRRRRPLRRTAPSTPCTTATRRSAGWCRCG